MGNHCLTDDQKNNRYYSIHQRKEIVPTDLGTVRELRIDKLGQKDPHDARIKSLIREYQLDTLPLELSTICNYIKDSDPVIIPKLLKLLHYTAAEIKYNNCSTVTQGIIFQIEQLRVRLTEQLAIQQVEANAAAIQREAITAVVSELSFTSSIISAPHLPDND